MSNVAYIKQQAIEIANNSSHRVIIGVMNHKDSDADCSAVIEDADYYNSDSNNESDYYSMDSYLARKIDRVKRREARTAKRLARRGSY